MERLRVFENFWKEMVAFALEGATSAANLEERLAALLTAADEVGFVPPAERSAGGVPPVAVDQTVEGEKEKKAWVKEG